MHGLFFSVSLFHRACVSVILGPRRIDYGFRTSIHTLGHATAVFGNLAKNNYCACSRTCSVRGIATKLTMASKASYEPGRTKPYHIDIRWRMVWQREVLGLKLKDVANNLGAVKFLLLNLVVNEPHLYLRELRQRIQNYTGFESVICEYLKEMNFSRQCMRVIAKQRDEKLRKDFLVDISLISHICLFSLMRLVRIEGTV